MHIKLSRLGLAALSAFAMPLTTLTSLASPVVAADDKNPINQETFCNSILNTKAEYFKSLNEIILNGIKNKDTKLGKNEATREELVKKCIEKGEEKGYLKNGTLNAINSVTDKTSRFVLLHDDFRNILSEQIDIERGAEILAESIKFRKSLYEITDIFYSRIKNEQGKTVIKWKEYKENSQQLESIKSAIKIIKSIDQTKVSESIKGLITQYKKELNDFEKISDNELKIAFELLKTESPKNGKTFNINFAKILFSAIKFAPEATEAGSEDAKKVKEVILPQSKLDSKDPISLHIKSVTNSAESEAVKSNKVTSNEFVGSFDLKMIKTANQEEVEDFGNDKVSITLSIENTKIGKELEKDPKGLQLLHFHKNESAKEIDFKYNEADKTIKFSTSKFSEFVFVKKSIGSSSGSSSSSSSSSSTTDKISEQKSENTKTETIADNKPKLRAPDTGIPAED